MSEANLKVVLFLVLMGLFAGLTQAQTPQVKLLWEKQFDSPVAGYSILEIQNKLVVPVVTEKGVYICDAIGNAKELFRSKNFWKVISSGDGRSVDISSPENRFRFDIISQRVTAVPKDVNTKWVSLDGSRRIGVHTHPPTPGYLGAFGTLREFPDNHEMFSDTTDTLFLRNNANKIIMSKKIPRLSDICFSATDNGFYTVNADPSYEFYHLTAYDLDGRERWQVSRKIAVIARPHAMEEGGLVSLEGKEGRDGWFCIFYNNQGVVVSEVDLGFDVNLWACEFTSSTDGKRILLYNGSSVALIQRDPPRVLWLKSGPGGGKPGMYTYGYLSSDGQYTAVNQIGESKAKTRTILYNSIGQEVWRREFVPRGGTPAWGKGIPYLGILCQGGSALAVYKID